MSLNGTIMELVAKGQMDSIVVDLENKKSIFNYTINKYNKYAKSDSLFYPEGKPNWANTIRFYIEKKGDLLYGLYLVVKLPQLSIANLNTNVPQDLSDTDSIYRVKYSDYIGNVVIEKVSLYINGQLIDEQDGEYMQIYTDLYMSDWNRKSMLGMDNVLNRPNLKIDPEIIYIPLKFWFCNEIEKPLPLIAMGNSVIYIDVKFRNFNNCVSVLEYHNDVTGDLYSSDKTHLEVPIMDAFLQANYYLLDLEERKEMATKEWNIIITQSQVRTMNLSSSGSLEIDFNHIVKDIMFLVQSSHHKSRGEFFNFSAKTKYPDYDATKPINYKLWTLEPQRHLLTRARMLFNGCERIEWRDHKYFHYMQNHENYQNSLHSYVYVYSFNVDPTRFENSIGCNFSRLDNAQLQVEIKPHKFLLNKNSDLFYSPNNSFELKCYATNFNVLVISHGLVSLMYVN